MLIVGMLLVIMLGVSGCDSGSSEIPGDPEGDYYELEISIVGQGETEPEEGKHELESGSTVPLYVFPEESSKFAGWEGEHGSDVVVEDENDEKSYKLFIDRDKQVTANFIPESDGETEDFAGGQGTAKDPYRIRNWYHLNNVRHYGVEDGKNYQEGTHFILLENLDDSTEGYSELVGYKTGNNKGWEPISGDSEMFSDPFTGEFDGNNRAISDLYIDRPEQQEVGLFAYILDPGLIINLELKNVDITGEDVVGGLAGINETGKVRGVKVQGNIKSDEDAFWSTNVGGIIGTNYEGGEIIKSGAEVNVSGNSVIGGLVGYNAGAIKESYAKGLVQGTGDSSISIGGLAGENGDSIISDSYADVKVEGEEWVGGLVGVNDAVIERSYSAGGVTEKKESGGFAGINNGTITHSYFDYQTTGQDDDFAVGHSTDNMRKKSTFQPEWDFENVWQIEEGIRRLLQNPLII